MLEANKIYCGDNIELCKEIDDNNIDLTITSPPYSNIRKYQGFSWDFEKLAKELYRVTSDGGIVCWIINDQYIKGGRDLQSFKQAIYFKETCGFTIHDVMIYQKSGFNFPANNRYHQVYEYILVLTKGKIKTFNPLMDRKNAYPGQKAHGLHRGADENSYQDMSQIIKAKPAGEYGKRYNVWYVKVGKRKGVAQNDIAYKHPAIFPESLCGDLIKSFSNENDLIFDPFMGSGTVAIVCNNLKRNFLGLEISQEYCDIANKRLL
jgi:site-specific DNA-methyltransferase (adenine-specific)